jgi:hypothetical protein
MGVFHLSGNLDKIAYSYVILQASFLGIVLPEASETPVNRKSEKNSKTGLEIDFQPGFV